jgi:hypothetical protein
MNAEIGIIYEKPYIIRAVNQSKDKKEYRQNDDMKQLRYETSEYIWKSPHI